MNDNPIPRYAAPTFEDLKPLLGNDVTEDVLHKLADMFAGEVEPEDISEKCAAWVKQCYHTPPRHEKYLAACDDLLGGHGVEALEIEDADSYTDGRIRMCPPLSYVNFGDTYVLTIGRDHEHGKWVITSYGDFHEEYCADHKIGDYKEFEEEPERCPSCHKSEFTLEHYPDSARGDSYSWVCKSCNHHCFAVEGFAPDEAEDEGD